MAQAGVTGASLTHSGWRTLGTAAAAFTEGSRAIRSCSFSLASPASVRKAVPANRSSPCLSGLPSRQSTCLHYRNRCQAVPSILSPTWKRTGATTCSGQLWRLQFADLFRPAYLHHCVTILRAPIPPFGRRELLLYIGAPVTVRRNGEAPPSAPSCRLQSAFPRGGRCSLILLRKPHAYFAVST
jgi:hypothetical protein